MTNTEPTKPAATAAEAIARANSAAATAREFQRQAQELAAVERAARLPVQPPIGGAGDRAIVSFSRYQSGRLYNYAAIGWRVGEHVRWAVTGTEKRRFNWAALLDFIGEANWPSMYLMVEDRLLGPTAEQAGPVVETVGNFGRVRATPVDPFAGGVLASPALSDPEGTMAVGFVYGDGYVSGRGYPDF